jgi:dihydroorotate dehydrogenase (NAD+) catalytic subunit
MNGYDLSVDLCGVRLEKPWMNASGVLADISLLEAWAPYFGAIVTKSTGARPRIGYQTPNVCRTGRGTFINAMGLPNPGYKAMAAEVAEAKARMKGVPVIGSFYGDNEDEAAEVAAAMGGVCDILEQNVSCPNIKPGEKTGIAVGTDPELMYRHVNAARRATKKPLMVKVSPAPYIGNQKKFDETLDAAKQAGADGWCAINTIPGGMAINYHTGLPVLSAARGGVSGEGLKPIGVGCVHYIRNRFPGMPIVGVGGITDAYDAVEYMMAGATAVQIGTALGDVRDAERFMKDMSGGFEAIMLEKHLHRASELTGWRKQ